MYRSNCHIDYNPLFLIISKETSTASRRRPSGRLNLNGLEQWKQTFLSGTITEIYTCIFLVGCKATGERAPCYISEYKHQHDLPHPTVGLKYLSPYPILVSRGSSHLWDVPNTAVQQLTIPSPSNQALSWVNEWDWLFRLYCNQGWGDQHIHGHYRVTMMSSQMLSPQILPSYQASLIFTHFHFQSSLFKNL